MKTKFAKLIVVLAVLIVGTLATTRANADCGVLEKYKHNPVVQPQSWNGDNGPASLLLVHDSDDPIVGMWQVNFIAEGNTGPLAPPDGVPIDNALVTWHADGTELMNSGRPPQDGNFCMGVWEKRGWNRYKLNHFAVGNDTENAPGGVGNPAGPTHIAENIVLGHDGNTYGGTFTLDAYDTSGNNVAHIIGIIKAKRVTVKTTSVFQ